MAGYEGESERMWTNMTGSVFFSNRTTRPTVHAIIEKYSTIRQRDQSSPGNGLTQLLDEGLEHEGDALWDEDRRREHSRTDRAPSFDTFEDIISIAPRLHLGLIDQLSMKILRYKTNRKR